MILNLLCILAFFCLPLPAQNPEKGAAHALRCLWSFDQEQNDCLLQLPEHFFVSTLTYSCDVPFERDELLALLGFDEGQLVAREQENVVDKLRGPDRLLDRFRRAGKAQHLVEDAVHLPHFLAN